MASVIGLAPIRPCLKDRLRELLCIHGRAEWIDGVGGVMALNAPTLQSSIAPFNLLAPEVGIAPTSPRLQRGANLPQLPGGNGLPSRSRQAKVGRPAR